MARILIVDDSPTETFRLKEILGKNNHDIIEASNGADGVTLAEIHVPDLILMDVAMPGLNGFQATRYITQSANTKHIPVIIMSTKDQSIDEMWGKQQGAVDYLKKPLSEVILLGTIQKYLEI
ncbi:MAG: response regulator [Acinetobacter sp.]